MKKIIGIFTNSNGELRAGWVLLLLLMLIFLGEMLLIRPVVRLLNILGLSEVTGVIPDGWEAAIGEILKRILRVLWVFSAIRVTLRYGLNKKAEFIGFDFKNPSFRLIFFGLGLGFAVQIVSMVLMGLAGWLEIRGFVWAFNPGILLFPALLYTLVICFETGFLEEMLFRGVLFNLFEHRYRTLVGVMISSLVFGLVHFSGFEGEFAWWFSISSSILCGLVFVQSYLLFRNLWLPIAFHAGWHLAMRTLGTVGLSGKEAVLLVTRVNGPAMMVSTRSGGAGLTELAGLLAVSLLLHMLNRRKKKRGKRKGDGC